MANGWTPRTNASSVARGVNRYMNRIVETSFFMMMAAGAFFFSNNASAFWADRYFDQMSYVFFVMTMCGTW